MAQCGVCPTQVAIDGAMRGTGQGGLPWAGLACRRCRCAAGIAVRAALTLGGVFGVVDVRVRLAGATGGSRRAVAHGARQPAGVPGRDGVLGEGATGGLSAQAALTGLGSRGEHVKFQAVARAGRVSRRWLYTQPEVRAEIERLGDRPPATNARPARERASDASLHQRVEALCDEN